MVYFLLVLGLAAIAFELTQPGFGFAGFSGVGLRGAGRLRAHGGGPVVAGVRAAARRDRAADGWTCGSAACRGRHGSGLAAFGAGSVLAWNGVDPSIRISPWLIGGAILASLLYYGFALTVAHPVARQDRRNPARADRADRGGEGAAGAGRAGAREGSALARTGERRSDRSGHADPRPGRRRADPAGRGGACVIPRNSLARNALRGFLRILWRPDPLGRRRNPRARFLRTTG